MGALPPFRQLQFNQIPGAPNWFAGFLTSFNLFTGAVYDTVNGNTTFGDNIPRQLKQFSYTVPATGYTAQKFACTLKAKPTTCLLAQVEQTSPTFQYAATDAPISLNQWTWQAGTIQLDSIVGLVAGRTYNLTFLVF